MTDYNELNLVVTPAPHIRGLVTTRSIMLDVIIALLPALAYEVFWFGLRALVLTGISVTACLLWEGLNFLQIKIQRLWNGFYLKVLMHNQLLHKNLLIGGRL